jgi:enoyl-CoA hydratase
VTSEAGILFDVDAHIATITISRPEVMNSLTVAMLLQLNEAFDEVARNDAIRVAIFTGAGDRSFCSGSDVREVVPRETSVARQGIANDDPTGRRTLSYTDPTARLMSNVYKPIICAVNGYCIAGGVEFMLGTDIRIAAEHATFALNEVSLGVVPRNGAAARMAQQLSWAFAMELILSGERISAHRAAEIGLINRVVAAEDLMPEARNVAERIARNAPLAVQATKEIMVRSLRQQDSFLLEALIAAPVFQSEDAREGPKAWAEKREPRYRGR